MLGGLLDTMVIGLRRLPTIKLAGLPRMADFARWAVACDTPGRFEDVYADACRQAQAIVLASSQLVTALRGFLLRQPACEWRGTWLGLLQALEHYRPLGCRNWPASHKGLSNAIRRLAPALREAKCELADEGHSRAGNVIYIRWP